MRIRTRIFKLSPRRPDRAAIQEIARIVRDGGLFAFPTDTVYGIGCGLFFRDSVRRIYALKGRGTDKPLPILVSSTRDAEVLAASVSDEARRLMKRFWPGPLTLVFSSSAVASLATGGRDTVALRLPRDRVILAVLKACGLPLASTSANLSGRPALVTGEEVTRRFSGRLDAIIDAGPSAVGVPSTVLDVSSYPFTIRREGAISRKKLLELISKSTSAKSHHGPPLSRGR